MTVKQLVEELQLKFTQYGDTQLLLDINQALKTFSAETGIIKASENITPVAGTIEYDLFSGGTYTIITPTSYLVLDPDTSTQYITIPALLDTDIVEIYNVEFLDANGDAAENTYNFKVDKRTIRFYGYDWNEIEDIKDVTTIRVHAKICHPDVVLTDTFSIDARFHDAILFKLYEKYLALAGDYPGSSYFGKMYNKKELEAKKFVNTNRDSTSGRPVNRIM